MRRAGLAYCSLERSPVERTYATPQSLRVGNCVQSMTSQRKCVGGIATRPRRLAALHSEVVWQVMRRNLIGSSETEK